MNYASIIKEIGRGAHGSRDLGVDEARQLFGAMLDGGVPELELGAVLLALRMKTESVNELLGFSLALNDRVHRLQRPNDGTLPVVLPSYNGARRQPNLVPLVAMALHRIGVPVLVHGLLDGNGRVATAYILRELGIMPCATLAQAQRSLDEGRLTFVPTAVLSPGIAQLLGVRARLGVRNSAHTVVKLMDPFGGDCLRVVAVTHPDYMQKLGEVLVQTRGAALLMKGTEGEPYAAPRRRPRMELYRDGHHELLFEQERMTEDVPEFAPQDLEAAATAQYVCSALEGVVPMPLPVVNQIACCLYGSGYTDDLNLAKAIAVVQTRSMAA